MDYVLIYKSGNPIYTEKGKKDKIHRYYKYLEADIVLQSIRINALKRDKLLYAL